VVCAVFFGLQETTGRLFTDNRFVILIRNKTALIGPNIPYRGARAYPDSHNSVQLAVFLLSRGRDC